MLKNNEINIGTADGTMNMFVVYPEGGALCPPVIMYTPSPSIRYELNDMAAHLAGHGYVVLLPNVYYRMVRVIDIDANRLFDEQYAPVKEFMNG